MLQVKRKIAVLGTGNVGATIAYNLILQGLASEIVLVDINKDKAEAEALDLKQCRACIPSVKIRSGEYEDVKGSDIVIVTFGVGRKPDQTRLDLAKVNIGILKGVIPTVARIAPKAMYIIVSNPVDVLTYVTMTATNLPNNRVIGTGTLLDANRLAEAIAEYCKVDVSSVNAFVFGEHGDACIVPWSLCTVAGVPLKTYCKDIMGVKEEKLNEELDKIYTGRVKSGSKIIKGKGATFYAIAASVGQLVKAITSDSNAILPVSTMLDGQYGANNLCMGIPCVVNSTGVVKIVELPMLDEEKEQLKEKIASLDKTYNALEIRK